MEPPESISNSEVKRVIANDSVGLPHVKVGHHQVITLKTRSEMVGFFYACRLYVKQLRKNCQKGGGCLINCQTFSEVLIYTSLMKTLFILYASEDHQYAVLKPDIS